MNKQYNFDEIIERENTDCVKYDLRDVFFGNKDVIPMWVADMDFKTPDFIIEALRKRLDHEILGYSIKSEAYFQSIVDWYQNRHHWSIKKEWIQFSPGVVPALGMIVETYTEIGDECIVQTPVYFPFFSSIEGNSRKLIFNPLQLRNGRYKMDFEDLKQKITDKTKMLFLCNPHNPGGSVWKKEELQELAQICLKNNILVLADEIHCDLVYEPNKYIPFASLSEDVANITITTNAPSKTFNMAGLSTSSVIIANKELRVKFQRRLDVTHLYIGNLFGNVALEAAYKYGENWLNQLLTYLKDNIDFAINFIEKNIPQIKPIAPEATYLLWLDCRQLAPDSKSLKQLMIDKAGVGLNDGATFGKDGAGFMRMNVACPRSILERALVQMAEVCIK